MPPNRWVGSTSGGICPSLRSGFPGAALYSLTVPTAWPPALRAESEIPPPAFGRPPPFLKGGFILSRGPKGSLEPAGWPPLARKSFQPSAFRILSPFSALVVYSESGAQPSAIQTLLSRTRLRAPARPGGERRLGTVHETSGGPSRSHPAQPVALEGSRGLPGQSLATFF